MESGQSKKSSYLKAKDRVTAIKKFYQHLVIFVVINALISWFKISRYMDEGASFEDTMTRLDIYVVWMVWGFFLVLQALRTFNSNIFLGKGWEEKKIREYMNEGNS